MSKSTSRSWAPDDKDHLIYKWVIFDGETQNEVASRLNISQPTVSRVIKRYERWQAHASPREDGRLDHDERLRVQRWLTFERNEKILASCLRIAADLEGFIDASRSTLQHPSSSPSNDIIVRTEHTRVDRTGTVARYLRLAFRINMEQLKLAELAPLPPLPPMTAGELAAEEAQAAATRAEMGRKSEVGDPRSEVGEAVVGRAFGRPSMSGAGQSEEEGRPEARPTVNNVNNMQPEYADESDASADEPCGCAAESNPEKSQCMACITPAAEPEWERAASSGAAWSEPYPVLTAPAG